MMNDEILNEWHDIRAERNPSKGVDGSNIMETLQDKYAIYAACVPYPLSFNDWLWQSE